eukprot:2654592-Rhodomonas_salina.2
MHIEHHRKDGSKGIGRTGRQPSSVRVQEEGPSSLGQQRASGTTIRTSDWKANNAIFTSIPRFFHHHAHGSKGHVLAGVQLPTLLGSTSALLRARRIA